LISSFQVKTLVAVAMAMGTTLSASAQSTVALYGVADLGYRSVKGLDAGNAASPANATALASGINTTSRMGFRGSEDLGNGLKAEFNLETGWNLDSGVQANATKFFDRASFVGLRGNWGGVTVGRQTTVLADALGTIDPMGNRFAGFNPNIQIAALSAHRLGQEFGSAGATSGSYRMDNSFKYTGTAAGFTGRLMSSLGEQANDNTKLSSQGASLAYKAKDIEAILAISEFKSTADLNLKAYLGGINAKVGAGQLKASMGRFEAQTSATATTENKTSSFGGNYPITPSINLVGGYYKVDRKRTGSADDGFTRKIAFAEYILSKRSLAYVGLDSTAWKNGYQGSANKATASGFSVGLKHTY
jgi:predicted porin